MKTSTNTMSKYVYVPATRAQKIWGVVALAGLFACGLMVGLTMRGNNQSTVTDATVQLTESQCDIVADKIQYAVKYSKLDDLEQWKKVYAESCGNHITTKTEVVSESKSENKLSTCEKIEKLLLRNLNAADSQNSGSHSFNASIYQKVSQYGCPENSVKYKKLSDEEMAIAAALGENQGIIITTNDLRTCEEIERALNSRLYNVDDMSGIEERMHNAEIFSTMAERGCPENSEKYKNLALRQIDVVSAVSDEQELIENKEVIVDTYEKLQMQEAARNFLNKMDKLINPATDFIFELERVINE